MSGTDTITRNPKDSIKSTWRSQDKSKWTPWHWFFEVADLHPVALDKPIPVFAKTDKMPHASLRYTHRWILAYASLPMLVHYAYTAYTGRNLTPASAALLYGFWLTFTAGREMRAIRRLGQTHGYLDGDKHSRDGVPDVRVREVVFSLLLPTVVRPVMVVVLAWDPAKTPESLLSNLGWLVVELTMFPLMVDFWFYWYHRAMHDVSWLWQFHRTHHLTKHPNALLSLYADGWQELFDVVVIPVLAFYSCRLMGLPMGFYETWVCYEYLIFVELIGHSGLRIRGLTPLTATPILQYFDMDLTIEDHDLHHRTGWKKSHNYGKQTRVWDTLFGTKMQRIEARDENVDYEVDAALPLF